MPPRTLGRTIGRVLSLGYPLPGPLVDNYTFLSAPAFFDYDALVVDIRALSDLLEAVISGAATAETFAGAPIGTTAAASGDVLLRDVLAQRREETGLLLERGGVIVVFVSPALAHRVDDVGEALDDYCWLPDDIAACCRNLHPSAGTRAHVVDFQHPLAGFVHGQLAQISYRAYFDAAAVPASSVFVRSEGGAAIGVELTTPSGRVIMLPAMKSPPPATPATPHPMPCRPASATPSALWRPDASPPGPPPSPSPGSMTSPPPSYAAKSDLDRAQQSLDEAQRAHDDLPGIDASSGRRARSASRTSSSTLSA